MKIYIHTHIHDRIYGQKTHRTFHMLELVHVSLSKKDIYTIISKYTPIKLKCIPTLHHETYAPEEYVHTTLVR